MKVGLTERGTSSGQHEDKVFDSYDDTVKPGRLMSSSLLGTVHRYKVYCAACLALSAALLSATLVRNDAGTGQLRLWEEVCDVFLGVMLCGEVVLAWRSKGLQHFTQDTWRLGDALIVALTLVCAVVLIVQRRALAVEGLCAFEGADAVLLGIRFALQPMRLVAVASKTARAVRDPQELPVQNDLLGDPRRPPRNFESVLSATQAALLREELPAHLRFQDWRLAYAPQLHGVSMRTFFRRQAGANVIVVQDSHGGLFGGFAPEPWRLQASSYGSREAFVFKAIGATDCSEEMASESIPQVFRALGEAGLVLQHSDLHHLRLGDAISVSEDFLHGTSRDCQTFGSPTFAQSGDFVIQHFECWQVGGGRLDV